MSLQQETETEWAAPGGGVGLCNRKGQSLFLAGWRPSRSAENASRGMAPSHHDRVVIPLTASLLEHTAQIKETGGRGGGDPEDLRDAECGTGTPRYSKGTGLRPWPELSKATVLLSSQTTVRLGTDHGAVHSTAGGDTRVVLKRA